MSFKLFEQGHSPQRIQQIKAQKAEEARLADQYARWSECERVLSIVRSMKPSSEPLTQSDLQLWQKTVSSLPSHARL
jgi:hypothetical protein